MPYGDWSAYSGAALIDFFFTQMQRLFEGGHFLSKYGTCKIRAILTALILRGVLLTSCDVAFNMYNYIPFSYMAILDMYDHLWVKSEPTYTTIH